MTRNEIIEALVDLGLIKSVEGGGAKGRIPENADERMVIAVLRDIFPDINAKDFAVAIGYSLGDFQSIAPIPAPAIDSPKWEIAPPPLREKEIPPGVEDFDMNEVGLALTEVYKALKERGALSDEEQRDLFEKTAGGVTSYRDVEIIIDALRSAGATPEELGTLDEIYSGPDYSNEFSPEEEAWLAENQPGYGGPAALIAEQEARIEAGTSPVGETYQERLDALGIGDEEPEQIRGPDRLWYNPESKTILDRVTGKELSEDQWNVLKTDEEKAAGYAVTRRISDVARGLLESGKFRGPAGITKEPAYGSDGKRLLDPAGNPAYRTKSIVGKPESSGPQYEWITRTKYNPETFKLETVRIRQEVPGWKQQNRNFFPVEDIALPSPVVTEAWQVPSYDYNVGGGRMEWLGFAPKQRKMRIKYAEDQGLISAGEIEAMGGYEGSPLNFAMMDLWENVSAVASQYQWSQFDALNSLGVAVAMDKARQAPSGSGYRGSGSRGPTYSVPASLREIPDYKTLAERTKSVFDSELGRDMEDWELSALADELKDKYIQANNQRIKINKEAWNDAVAGGSTSVDFSEVEEPEEGLQFDIGEKYKSEIDRYDRVEDRANNRRLLLDSISVGERMI